MYYIQIAVVLLLLAFIVYIYLKIRKDAKNASNRLLSIADYKTFPDLQISHITNRSFFLERNESLPTRMTMHVEKNHIYIYFGTNTSNSHSNGPFIICNDHSKDSDFWIKYYIKKIHRHSNGTMNMVFSTKNSILFSKYSITIKFISEQDFEFIKMNIIT
ncbi:hypothetical protein Q766_14810 [Flavobacterium subsaxonicum WB 4.1-42 = DSM 21790]|uniref:Uncharacterized protein n=1 Tax=Flavobacterium subsaxonicum WB 4.1-42 = DSM 21790 TaxID=1121898 RepID=A0A0A2MVE5_9FLAO|nr:hypothetical protein Q766_14810 [Flavobacterium subsaxonicum WB 4.1-42 = DSM 21790]